ncbi:MAG: non-homologous end-joining DNA ligase [Myxococcota bacterium]|nr:non-homologous end-joining DNA ligase [Myxococcota bacterium]
MQRRSEAPDRARARHSERAPARAERLPTIEPQLATLVREPPEGDAWLHEIKYDGFRAIAYLDRGEVHLVSRNGLSFDDRFAPVRIALSELPIERAIFDGEVCSLDESGRTKFEALQGAMRDGTEHALVYFVFDLLWYGNEDLRGLPLVERKERLARVITETGTGVVRRAEHVRGDGASFLDAAEKIGLEGLIAKRAVAPYRGGRSSGWQKVKVERREELVIIGFTPPKGSRQRFGALLLGIADREGSPLRYAGKVGTGFDVRTLEELHDRMLPLRTERAPVGDPPRERGAVWVRPELVAEIRYTEWTADGKLRHPTFLGLRIDKSAEDVRRERPIDTREIRTPRARSRRAR